MKPKPHKTALSAAIVDLNKAMTSAQSGDADKALYQSIRALSNLRKARRLIAKNQL